MPSAKDHWCMLLIHLAALAFSLALFRAGNNIAARIPIMAMTTSNSMSVKARAFLRNQALIIFRIPILLSRRLAALALALGGRCLVRPHLLHKCPLLVNYY